MKRVRTYICPTCKAAKTINAHVTQSTDDFEKQLPEKILCGFRGCEDYAVPPTYLTEETDADQNEA